MDEKKTRKTLMLIAVIGTTIFSFLVAAFLIMNHHNSSCGYEEIVEVGTKTTTNYSYSLDSPNKQIGLLVPTANKEYINYELKAKLYSDYNNKISVFSGEEEIKSFYVPNGTSRTKIILENLSNNDYLLLKCDTCNASNVVTPQQEILGENYPLVVLNGNTVVSYEDSNTLNYELVGIKKCRDYVKTFFWLWVGLIGFCFLGFAIVKGYEEIQFIPKW